MDTLAHELCDHDQDGELAASTKLELQNVVEWLTRLAGHVFYHLDEPPDCVHEAEEIAGAVWPDDEVPA
jgi:hypothetical protein